MRTPWKVLYDWSVLINGLNLGLMPQAGALLWIVCVGGPIAAMVSALSAFATWIAPASQFARYLEGHYWSIVIVLAVLFFFYFVFRMVWDGLKEPTVHSPVPNEMDD